MRRDGLRDRLRRLSCLGGNGTSMNADRGRDGRRAFVRLAAACALLPGTLARAQPAAIRVAWVSSDDRNAPSPNLQAFRDGMRALGYVEGRNLVLDAWWGDGDAGRLSTMAPDIARAQPTVIVAAGGLALFALRRAGVKAPTVFSISADPVEAKIADSYARPGGTCTGISLFTLALVGKRLELIREVLPRARRIAMLTNNQHPGERSELDTTQAAAGKLGFAARYFPVYSADGLDAALADIGRGRDDAIVAFADGFMLGHAGRIAKFSHETRIPAVDGWAAFAEAGNLMTYGPVIEDVYRRLAEFVDRIARGARPADLPIELPRKIELVVNVRSAKAMGIVVPPSVLARADRVIA